MTVEDKIDILLEEAKQAEQAKHWSNKVTKNEKFHTPPGLFKEATAEKIAEVVSQNFKAEYKTASSRLNFFLNRGGKNVPEPIRAKVKKALTIIHQKYSK